MDNYSVDNSQETSYNINQDAIYDAVAGNYQIRVDVVKLDEQKPINDTSCQHKELVPDPEDTIGDSVMYMCTNPQCGVGFYVRQT